MPKAVLEFNLPEEQDEFILAKNGGKYYSLLCDISNIIRGHNKYDVAVQKSWELLEDAMNEFDMDEVS